MAYQSILNPHPVTGPLTDAQLRATAVPVSLISTTITGTVAATQSGTWNIGSITTLPALAAGGNIIGSLAANQSVNNAQIGGVAVAVGSGVTGTGVQRVVLATDVGLPAGANNIGTTNGPTLTKGTQGATGYSVQDLKDAGRVLFSAATVVAGVTTVTAEALMTLTPTRAGAAGAAATTIQATSGKTLCIEKISFSHRSTAAAVLSARSFLRMNPGGAVALASPIIDVFSTTQQAAALAEAGDTVVVTYPGGLEISGTQNVGISHIASAITGALYVSIVGFEY